MKRFTNTISSLLIAMALLLTSCGENAVKEISGSETLTESDFSSEELASAVETLSIRYSITVISDDNSEIEINSDADLTSYSKSNGKAKIKFPIEITVDGEIILVEDHKELKALIVRKKKGHRHTSFKLVYPISVNTAEGVLEIADRNAMKTYKQSLEKGVRPEFVFPISVTVGEDKIEVNSKEALKKLFHKGGKGGSKEGKHKRRKLVYPISVNTAEGVLEIADRNAMKTYKQSLEKGVRPEFVFPISVTVGEDEIEVNSKEALKKLFHKGGKGGSKEGKHKRRKLVYPISVNTAEGVLEIADRNAMKTYKQSLEKGVRPEFVFPISVKVGEDEIEVNSKEALKKLFQKRKRRGRK